MRQNAGQNYALGTKRKEMQAWYDLATVSDVRGHLLPLDVINYVNLMRTEPDAEPRGVLWLNTSGNDISSPFPAESQYKHPARDRKADCRSECIAKKINQELTYRDFISKHE